MNNKTANNAEALHFVLSTLWSNNTNLQIDKPAEIVHSNTTKKRKTIKPSCNVDLLSLSEIMNTNSAT